MATLYQLCVVFCAAQLLFHYGFCSPNVGPPPPSSASGPPTAKRYTINLDLPPEQRWVQVAKDHEQALTLLLQSIKSALPEEVSQLVATFGDEIAKYMPYPYGPEIVGLANSLQNTSISDAVLGNVLYELTAYGHEQRKDHTKMCTSIVAQSINGTIYHGRNLDYSFPDLLRELTIIVEFVRGGRTLYTGTTFAGMVGLLTGQKPHAYTISVDERDQGFWWMNVLEAFIAGTHGISTLHVRDALADKDMDFGAVVDFLAEKPFIAPCYVIVGGTSPNEGVVITRDRSEAQDVWRMDANNGDWFLVETNYDHWKPPPDDDDRRDPAIKAMVEMSRGGLNATSLFRVMSTPPVLNSGTTYTVVMSAALPEVYGTWIRSDALE